MNNKFNMVLILSIIFLISSASFCDGDPDPIYPPPDCQWTSGSLFSFDYVYLNHPENPPSMFVAHFPSDPITSFLDITFYGGVFYVTSTGSICSGLSERKLYGNGDDFGFSWIYGVPKPEDDILGTVRVEIYSDVYWDNSSNEVRVYWDEIFDAADYIGPKSATFNSTIISASSDGAPSIPGGIKPIYQDGEMV